MQNNVTELTERLRAALDDNYNVIDMPEVIQCVSLLETAPISKEVLEATRLGKMINEIRRKTSGELKKRAFHLVKKWREMILVPIQAAAAAAASSAPDSNGQLKAVAHVGGLTAAGAGTVGGGDDDAARLKRRLAKDHHFNDQPPAKRPKINGQLSTNAAATINADRHPPPPLPPHNQHLLDFSSDNSNSSFKDVAFQSHVAMATAKQTGGGGGRGGRRDVIAAAVNSDSNSSMPEAGAATVANSISAASAAASVKQQEPPPVVEQPQPKKRGRKKGSKNHKNLLDEAETSFTNKLAVSRGNSKVKTTQELIAGLQHKSNLLAAAAAAAAAAAQAANSDGGSVPAKPKEDLSLRAAKLTERVSIIDQKLNTNANRYKNAQRRSARHNNDNNNRVVYESGSVVNDRYGSQMATAASSADEEIIVVDDVEAGEGGKGRRENDSGGGGDDNNNASFDETEDGAAVTRHNERRHDGSRSVEGETKTTEQQQQQQAPKLSLSVEEALALLPPVDRSWMEHPDSDSDQTEEQTPRCTCVLKENTDFSMDDEDDVATPPFFPRYEPVEDPQCPAKRYLDFKYRLNCKITAEDLHLKCIPNVNGNYSLGGPWPGPRLTPEGLYANVVPNVNIEDIPKDVKLLFEGENHKKYSISEEERRLKKRKEDQRDSEEQEEASKPNEVVVVDGGEDDGANEVIEMEPSQCDASSNHSDGANKKSSDDRCCCRRDSDCDCGVATSVRTKEGDSTFDRTTNYRDGGGGENSLTAPPSKTTGDSDNSNLGCVANSNNNNINNNANDSGDGSTRSFREWYRVVDTPSYNGETIRILPYVIID